MANRIGGIEFGQQGAIPATAGEGQEFSAHG
jgi:hypothetical protein